MAHISICVRICVLVLTVISVHVPYAHACTCRTLSSADIVTMSRTMCFADSVCSSQFGIHDSYRPVRGYAAFAFFIARSHLSSNRLQALASDCLACSDAFRALWLASMTEYSMCYVGFSRTIAGPCECSDESVCGLPLAGTGVHDSVIHYSVIVLAVGIIIAAYVGGMSRASV